MMIEQYYHEFVEHLKVPISNKTVDFVGMNFLEESDVPVFKVYYATQSTPEYRSHPYIAFLYQQDMLRDFEFVQDTISSQYVRMDSAIKRRTDSNMKKLFEFLDQDTPLFKEGENELMQLAKIRITDREDCLYSSIYHLGSTQRSGITESLKWYALTRWCEDPDAPWKKSAYRDREYLEQIRNINEKYRVLAGYAEEFLALCGGHLWMAGLDVFREGKRKYKIYVKGGAWLPSVFSRVTDGRLGSRVEESQEWLNAHPEYEYSGMAVSLDEKGKLICNLYLTMK